MNWCTLEVFIGDRWNVVGEWRCEVTTVEGWWHGERWRSRCKYWRFATSLNTVMQLQIQECNFFQVGLQTPKKRWEVRLRNPSTWNYTLRRHRTSNKLWSNSRWFPVLWRTTTDTSSHTQGDERTSEIQPVVHCLSGNHNSYAHTLRVANRRRYTPYPEFQDWLGHSSPKAILTIGEKKNYQKLCFYTNNY